MSFTYDVDALSSSTLYRIRLEIGDTDSDRVLLADEEITQIISEQSYYAQQVSACCRLIAAKFARHPQNLQLEGYEETTTEIYNRYMKMAKIWGAKVGYPWSGAIFSDDKQTVEENTDLVKPSFKRGMHTNG
jgi:hypothetical protein